MIAVVSTHWLSTQRWKLSPSNSMTRAPEGKAGFFLKHLTAECGRSNFAEEKTAFAAFPGFLGAGDFKSTGSEWVPLSSHTPVLVTHPLYMWACSPAWGWSSGPFRFLPFNQVPLGTVKGLRAWPTGSGIWSLQRSLKNVWPILTPVRIWKNARLALQTGPCTCGFSGLPAHDPSPSYQLAEKKQNEVKNIGTGLWGSNGGRFGEAGAMERYWRSWVWKGVGSSRTASWHWPWDSA